MQEKAELTPAAHIGGRPPYGYRVADKGTPGSYLVIDEDEAKVIRHVYDLVVSEGLNLRKATIRLIADGVTARSGKTWTRDNLRDRVMSTPVLDGALVFRGKHAKTDANAFEKHVWKNVTEIASNSERLQELAAEWVGMAAGDTAALVDRIASLDQQIEDMNASMAAVIDAAAKQSRASQLTPLRLLRPS